MKISMLFNLLLASKRILLCFFFFFLVSFNNFFTIPVVKENTKVKLALITPAGIPITFIKEIILNPPLVADKTLMFYHYKQEQQFIYSVF